LRALAFHARAGVPIKEILFRHPCRLRVARARHPDLYGDNPFRSIRSAAEDLAAALLTPCERRLEALRRPSTFHQRLVETETGGGG